ncbi:sulfate adenylyltransferase subunit 1 [Succinimonas sp.]|uniref:sulfate adenylyltransferase subunit 1 n=1 Tax=Succinimonas sp. TaxID=1936151 RepID=UPI0038698282
MTSEAKNEHRLLKFITCGSVDDGKSTLIGHILYDSKLLYADQIRALELESKVGSRGGKIDYSLLLDGLLAEREQGITIDVAYRYFTTDRRSFIVADTPGHEEYTRNMAVGASFADLAVILVDATRGVLDQTRRHARICALMGIRFFVFAVNKMDLTGFSEARFNEIRREAKELQKALGLYSVMLIPLSATEGDNVTRVSSRTPWYHGLPLLSYLEEVVISDDSHEDEVFFMPVQRVCRPDRTFRGFQGQIEEGSVAVGTEIVSLPSGEKGRISRILLGNRDVNEAYAGQPVTLQLDREVDVSRGCVLAAEDYVSIADTLTATVFWMDDHQLRAGESFIVKLGTRMLPGTVTAIEYALDVNTGEHRSVEALEKNAISLCRISLADRVVADVFRKHKTLGEFILIDLVTNMTSGCGVVESVSVSGSARTSADLRLRIVRYQPKVFVFHPGTCGADPELLSKAERELLAGGYLVTVIDNRDGSRSQVIPYLLNAGVSVMVLGSAGDAADADIVDMDDTLAENGILTAAVSRMLAQR